MLKKIEYEIKFVQKRNKTLITPCCGKTNSDGKFANIKGFHESYGYCFSCGVTSLPPSIYKDDSGNEFIWNDITDSFENYTGQLSHKNVLQVCNTDSNICNTNELHKPEKTQFIDLETVEAFCNNPNENNLLGYLRKEYKKESVEHVKKKYYLGTNKNGGAVFWLINIEGKAQKAKVVYYTMEGKRTDYFKVPYKNEDGYYSCLFGEHLINKPDNLGKPLILVESEKTALVCAIHLPQYTWLAYGGINGLTREKMSVLIGREVILVPDMSENAISILQNKVSLLEGIGVNVKIWDMTRGKTDEQLKEEGWYNCDLEDAFRRFSLIRE